VADVLYKMLLVTSSKGNIFKIDKSTGLFISPSGISDPCGTVAGKVTPKVSMSTEGERETPNFCPTLQVLDMCNLGALQRVSQELDYRIDICRVSKGAHIEHL
jgi:hypothetical protein